MADAPGDDAPLRVGIVGAGWAGGEHAASIARFGGARVHGVVDADPERARALAGALGTRAYPDVDALLADARLDALVVATPPGAHRAPAVAALDAGVAVLIEKPIARSARDAAAIVAAAEASGVVCAVGYQWRALDLLDTLRGRLAGQQVALLVSQGVALTQERAWFADPAQSGRLVAERASHHIDLQRAIAGDVVAVQGTRGDVAFSGRTLRADGLVEDVVSLTLRFASGATGAVHVAWAPDAYPARHHLTAFGTATACDLALDPEFALTARGSGGELAVSSSAHPFLREMQLFLQATRSGDPGRAACTAADAAGTLAVVLAAEEAIDRDDRVEVAPPPGVAAASPANARMD